MYDRTSAAVDQPTLSGVLQDYPLHYPSAELFPEMAGLAQRSQVAPVDRFELTPNHPRPQNLYPSSNHLWETYHIPFPGSSDTRTGVWATPDPIHMQNAIGQLPVLDMSQYGEIPTANEPAVLQRRGMYKDGPPITEYYLTTMAPTTHQIDLPEADVTCRKTDSSLPSSTPHSSQILPTVLDTPLKNTSECPLQAVSQSPSQECCRLWTEIPKNAIVITGSDRFVPQKLYRPLTEADRDRYLERVFLSPPIVFMTKEPLEWGIPLGDVRDRKTHRLVDKDVPVLQDCGPSVSVRINWPGYPLFRRRISSRNWRKTKGPITKEKLARSLAKTTGQFIEEMSRKPLEVDAERIWRVGIEHIRLEDLVLVSLHHVSKGSWQPQFRLRRDLALRPRLGPQTESHH